MKRCFQQICLLSLTAALATGCSSSGRLAAYDVTGGRYTPGVYEASAQGNIGPVTVEAAFSADELTGLRVVSHEENGVLSLPAIESIPRAIVDGQSLSVDVLAGATYTSNAILKATAQCIQMAGGDPSASAASPEEESRGQTVTLSADVVVVGAGLSGMCAAVAAASRGARVIVMEKLAYVGGSATSSLGSFMACFTPSGEASALPAGTQPVKEVLRLWREYTALGREEAPYPDWERLRSMLALTEPTLAWLTELGARFFPSERSDAPFSMLQVDVPGKTENRPAGKLISLLYDRAEEAGVIFLNGVRATRLVMASGEVAGVVGQSAQREYRLKAMNVILACGGFGSNSDMVDQLLPELTDAGYYNQGVSANTGDGMRMAAQAGAALYDDPWVIASFVSPCEALLTYNSRFLKLMEDNGLPEPDSSYDHLMVDAAGRRFMDEAASYSQQNITMVRHRGWPYYVLYDGVNEEIAEILNSGLETGEVFRGDTLEALAEQAGMSPSALRQTADRYSALAAAGEDADFGKAASRMRPVADQGPYYLVHFVCCFTGTLSGVHTDDTFRVLTQAGEAIPGLYAVGEMANRPFYDRMYVSGSSLTFGAAMGKIAGEFAADRR